MLPGNGTFALMVMGRAGGVGACGGRFEPGRDTVDVIVGPILRVDRASSALSCSRVRSIAFLRQSLIMLAMDAERRA